MKVALVENISREYEARRAGVPTPGHGIKARAAEATGRAGAYLMIASFVASMLVDHNRQNERIDSGYAPTKLDNPEEKKMTADPTLKRRLPDDEEQELKNKTPGETADAKDGETEDEPEDLMFDDTLGARRW